MLYDICQYDWSKVKPEIFGVLFESSTDKSKRKENGMYYTTEDDIMKIIKPLYS